MRTGIAHKSVMKGATPVTEGFEDGVESVEEFFGGLGHEMFLAGGLAMKGRALCVQRYASAA